MPATRNDLLSNTRVLLRWAFYITIGGVLLMAVLLVALLVKDPSSMSINLGVSALPPGKQVFAARVSVLGALVGCALLLPVWRGLLAIVDSARSGDPFVPENGARLRRIGWLLLALNIVMTTAKSAALHSAITFPPLSFTALLTVMMVFVLARIFDTGSRMRSELQDTV